NQTRRFTLGGCRKHLIILDVCNLACTGVVQVSNALDLRLAVAHDATIHELSKFLHLHLHALTNPRFEPRMKLTRCATCSLSTCSSCCKTSAIGNDDLNSIRYASFNARRPS